MRCIICGNNNRGMICPRCEYDESQNREKYPTLADDSKSLCATGALRAAFVTSMVDQIAAAKLVSNPATRFQPEPYSYQRNDAAAVVKHGNCGKDLAWDLNESGLLIIYGFGEMYDYRRNEAPWSECRSSIKSVELLHGLLNIGKTAFCGCVSLKNVAIPESVESIGYEAFDGCISLQNVTIPESVTSIGGEAFHNCTSLVHMVLPESVTSIEYLSFSGCSSLKTVTIPENATSIGGGAFRGCNSLMSVAIPKNVKCIGDNAFMNCSVLKRVILSDSVTSIGSCAFHSCTSLTSIKIPNSVTSIGKWVFFNCPSLVIRGELGSNAEAYAKENGIPFERL